MTKAQDLLIVIEVNKRLFGVNCLLVLLHKLGISSAAIESERKVSEYTYRVCEHILVKYLDGP